jgi:ABC-type dipeptide/oligopeptide/nickel transport system permease subunit
VSAVAATAPVVRSRGPWQRAAHRYARRPLGVAALAVLVALVAIALFGHHLARYNENFVDLTRINQAHGPTTAGGHWFGTDYLGRDLLSQLLYGMHTSVVIALMVAAVATAGGLLVGATAGYFGGWFDALLMQVVDLFVTVPALVVLFVSIVYFSTLTPRNIGYVLMLYLWTTVARAVRGSCVTLREREFVEAAHAAGASGIRVVLRHLLPNCIGMVIVGATTAFGQALVLEATVDFVNVGTTQVAGPTLGNLLADATKFGALDTAPWWEWVFPTLVLILLLVCANFVGDSLDDALAAR